MPLEIPDISLKAAMSHNQPSSKNGARISLYLVNPDRVEEREDPSWTVRSDDHRWTKGKKGKTGKKKKGRGCPRKRSP
jgi:hypothetical protein